MEETSVSKINNTMKKPVISAGVALYADGKYLLVRPFGGTTGGWGVPKGKRDEGEKIFNTALREFKEETGLDIVRSDAAEQSGITVDFFPFFHYVVETKEKKGKKYKKQVYVFHAEASKEITDYAFKCESFLEDGRPEVAEFGWFTPKQCLDVVVKSQKPMFQYLIDFHERNE